MKSKIYANKPTTIQRLQDEISQNIDKFDAEMSYFKILYKRSWSTLVIILNPVYFFLNKNK